MQIDREIFFSVLGGEAAAAKLSDEQKADALDHYLIEQLNAPDYAERLAIFRQSNGQPPTIRRGTGNAFGDGRQPVTELAPMPEHPSLLDFLRLRTIFPTVRHVLQSAEDARKMGASEEQILACLLHDLGHALTKVDHGWWCAQMVEPYVSEKVTFAIRYHQALRFFPDESVGYEYPELYVQIFGKDYVPKPYITAAYEYARNHPWYMEARLVTLHDLYAFDPDAKVELDPFIDIVEKHFRQPEEGLGFDNSPVAHMWRSVIYPDNPL
jgi:predicted HD phosphohydrolase